MRKRFRKILSEKGFTLVEMMIVVAILGLLAVVALPNFKKYQSRSKTSEAKLQLAAIYTAQQSFYADYTMYATCLKYMGYDPSGEINQRYYLTGFPTITSAVSPSAMTTAFTMGISTDAQASAANGGCANSGPVIDANYFLPGKRVGSSLATVASLTAGDPALNKASSNLSDSTAARDGLGIQDTANTLVFRAVATGVIDQDFQGGGTGANESSIFSINQDKRIFNPRLGY